MKHHRENRTLAEKQVDIKNLLLKHGQQGSLTWLSVNQIAKGIGMARNGRLKAMLDWMVECGSLQRREMERSGRWPGYEYSISEANNRFYNRPRTFNVRKKGKVVASLEMFS